MKNLISDLSSLQKAENEVQMWVRIYSQLMRTRDEAKKRLVELYTEKNTESIITRKKALIRLIALKAQN